jgi:hypothetical protein
MIYELILKLDKLFLKLDFSFFFFYYLMTALLYVSQNASQMIRSFFGKIIEHNSFAV